MWGWLSSIIDKLTSIVEGILAIPVEIVKAIIGLPKTILDGLKEIFIPDTEVINQQFNSTIENLKGRLGITMYNLDNLFDKSAAPTDVSANYNIAGVGTMNLKFADYTYLAQGVNFFRPYIRGLIVLLLFFFNVRQLMSMFGLDTGEMTHWVNNSRGRDE